ncbi:MAG TPA: DUF2480 family protein [Candidatus Acidoferrum sp.]|nr:DUF2480 family protein [Candidatus Acidoferrum sp.]
MTLEILDPDDFLADGMLRQDEFLDRALRYDWDRFRGKKVLVRGCSSGIIPPWVYMIITAKVSPIARSVRFGNEHDNIVISRSGTEA